MSNDKLDKCPHCEGGFGLQYPLYANDNFWIVCDYHPIVEGHALIIPKDHISYTGALSYELFNEYENLYKKVLSFLTETYGNAVIFEHGIVGQTVSHAHVHFLPFNKSIEDIVNEKNLLKPIDDLEEIRNIFTKEQKYLFIAINDKKWLVDPKIGVPRFFRDRISKALNVPERGDWKKAEENTRLMLEFKKDIQELINKWNSYYD